ncbi:MAG: glycoside hydrolase family 16 protein [Bacteroidales bacterium]|nr:glycoside hydrolase family 16 protein [Bacteroidales bacterium]
MRTRTVKLIFILIALGLCSCKKSSYDKPAVSNKDPLENDEAWELAWSDDFDKGTVNLADWSYQKRQYDECNMYLTDRSELYAAGDGYLGLRGMVNNIDPKDTASYLCGGIESKGKVTFGPGMVEVRARITGPEGPGAYGAWPAIWMLPDDEKSTILKPGGAEIDIIERYAFNSFVNQTVHTYFTYVLGYTSPENTGKGDILNGDWNVYGVEIGNDAVTFYVNGVSTFKYPRIETDFEGQYPFDEIEWYLIMDMQLGGMDGGMGAGPIIDGTLPVQMDIDWVRYYVRK